MQASAMCAPRYPCYVEILLIVAYGFAYALAAFFCLIGVAAVYREIMGESGSPSELYVGIGLEVVGLVIFWLIGADWLR